MSFTRLFSLLPNLFDTEAMAQSNPVKASIVAANQKCKEVFSEGTEASVTYMPKMANPTATSETPAR